MPNDELDVWDASAYAIKNVRVAQETVRLIREHSQLLREASAALRLQRTEDRRAAGRFRSTPFCSRDVASAKRPPPKRRPRSRRPRPHGRSSPGGLHFVHGACRTFTSSA
jgi:hypothetical protein